jgi:hypothetical protein
MGGHKLEVFFRIARVPKQDMVQTKEPLVVAFMRYFRIKREYRGDACSVVEARGYCG